MIHPPTITTRLLSAAVSTVLALLSIAMVTDTLALSAPDGAAEGEQAQLAATPLPAEPRG